MATIFWDARGMILIDDLEKGKPMNGDARQAFEWRN